VCVGSSITLSPTTGGTWSSSNSSIATITNGGVLTGVAGGSADMVFTNTTTTCQSALASGNITVNTLPTITVPSGGEVCVGATLNLLPNSGGTGSSSNTSFATITNGGLVTGIAAGSADMIFTNTTTNCQSLVASGDITVNALPVITVPNGGEVCVGSTLNLTPSSGGTWSSSNTSIATITNGGVATGVSGGTAEMIFTVTGTGCISPDGAGDIIVNALPIITVPNGGEVCVGATLNLTPNSGGTWSSSNTSFATVTNGGIVTGVAGGSADMVFTNTTTNCQSVVASGDITVNALPVITVPNGGEVCVGASLNLIPNSGGTWSSSNTSIATITNGGVVSGVAGGGADMVFTNTTTNCQSLAASGDITVNALPVITVPSGGEVCVGSSITLSPTTGGTWSSSNTSIATINNGGVVTGVAGGNADMVYTNTTTNCQSIVASGNIVVNALPTISTAPTISPSGCGMSDGSITGAVVSGNPTLLYNWKNGSNVTVGSAVDLTSQPAGTYNLEVTDGNSCVATFGPYSISNPGAPAAPTITSTLTTFCVGEDFTLSASSGASSPTFQWTGPNASSTTSSITITNAATTDAGNYSVTVTSSGCTSPSTNVTVVVNSLPVLSVPNGGEVCVGESITLSPTTGGTWSSSNTTVATITNGGVVSGLSGGTSEMIFTETATGCENTSNAGDITVNALPSITVPIGAAVCVGESITLSPTSGGTWSSSNTSFATITNGGVVTGLSGGTSEMIFTETATGCENTSNAGDITVNALPSITVPIGAAVCVGESITLSPTTGGTWSSSNTTVATITNGGVVTGLSGGTSEMIYTETATGCENASNAGDIIVNTLPTITVPSSGVLCENDTIYLSPSIGGTWSSDNVGVATIDGATGMVIGISGGTAEMTFNETTTGCSNTSNAGDVTVNALPTITVPNGGVVCEDLTLNLTPNTGGTWSSSDVTVATVTSAGLVTGISGGTADMIFNNTTTGCNSLTTSGTITVNPSDDPSFTYGGGTFCLTGSDPTPIISGVGGGVFSSTPAGLSLNSSTGEITLSTSSSNTFAVTYTTSGTCPSDSTVQLTTTLATDATFSYAGSPYCENSGSATVTFGAGASGGVFTSSAGLSLNATNGSVNLNTSLPGTYTVFNDIAASGGCAVANASSDIVINPLDNSDFSYSSAAFCENSLDPTPNITGVAGGTFSSTPVGLTIDSSTGEVDLSASTTGVSFEVVYLTNGTCPNSDTLSLIINTAPVDPTISTASATNSLCLGESLIINATGSGTNITYEVYDAPTGGTLIGTAPLTVTPSSTDDYYITAIDLNGCANISGVQNITVTVNPLPALTVSQDTTICPNVTVTLSAVGTGDFAWSTGETTGSITVSPSNSTTYTVELTDVNTCIATEDIIIGVQNITVPVAIDDSYDVESGVAINLEVLLNDNYSSVTTNVIVIPQNGSADELTNGTIDYLANADYVGADTFTYQICDITCPTLCDTATVDLNVNPIINIVYPNILTPNGDGFNDILFFNGLEYFPENELEIYNRWGERVYYAKPYMNDWTGLNNSDGAKVQGINLGSDTYYYIFKLSPESEVVKSFFELIID
jgi:gliding motility-associated-like protein